jgi:hypothetical protein
MTFIDVSGIRAKTRVAFVKSRSEGTNSDCDAKRAFGLKMKLTDKLTEAETTTF